MDKKQIAKAKVEAIQRRIGEIPVEELDAALVDNPGEASTVSASVAVFSEIFSDNPSTTGVEPSDSVLTLVA